jgi:hypothetical protein
MLHDVEVKLVPVLATCQPCSLMWIRSTNHKVAAAGFGLGNLARVDHQCKDINDRCKKGRHDQQVVAYGGSHCYVLLHLNLLESGLRCEGEKAFKSSA